MVPPHKGRPASPSLRPGRGERSGAERVPPAAPLLFHLLRPGPGSHRRDRDAPSAPVARPRSPSLGSLASPTPEWWRPRPAQAAVASPDDTVISPATLKAGTSPSGPFTLIATLRPPVPTGVPRSHARACWPAGRPAGCVGGWVGVLGVSGLGGAAAPPARLPPSLPMPALYRRRRRRTPVLCGLPG